MNRRSILKGALGGVVGLTLPPFARDAFAQASPAVVPVSDGFVMLTGAGGNVLVRTASTGQVLVDNGAAEFTDAVLKRLRELPGASGDGLLPAGRGPVRESAAQRGSPDRDFFYRRPDPR